MLWMSRFSLRTALICLVGLSLYYGCWGPTKTKGVFDVWVHVNLNSVGLRWSTNLGLTTTPELPLVVSMLATEPQAANRNPDLIERRYYFWFFGYVTRLPVTRQIRCERLQGPVGFSEIASSDTSSCDSVGTL